jgi:hypothetical protein
VDWAESTAQKDSQIFDTGQNNCRIVNKRVWPGGRHNIEQEGNTIIDKRKAELDRKTPKDYSGV